MIKTLAEQITDLALHCADPDGFSIIEFEEKLPSLLTSFVEELVGPDDVCVSCSNNPEENAGVECYREVNEFRDHLRQKAKGEK